MVQHTLAAELLVLGRVEAGILQADRQAEVDAKLGDVFEVEVPLSDLHLVVLFEDLGHQQFLPLPDGLRVKGLLPDPQLRHLALEEREEKDLLSLEARQ